MVVNFTKMNAQSLTFINRPPETAVLAEVDPFSFTYYLKIAILRIIGTIHNATMSISKNNYLQKNLLLIGNQEYCYVPDHDHPAIFARYSRMKNDPLFTTSHIDSYVTVPKRKT